MCKLVVAKIGSPNLKKRNMPRYFQHLQIFIKVETLAASGGIFEILTLYVVHTKTFVQGVFFLAPLNLTKSQALYNWNWPPQKFSKYKNL